MKKIFYFGYYDTAENKSENRNFAPAATNKMSYIIAVLDKLGYDVEVFSASQTLNKKRYPKKTVTLGERSRLHLFATLPWGNKIKQLLSRLYIRLQYRNFIIKNIGKDDTLIVYHSVPYSKFITRMKKKCGFKLVLEVEEIYADVNGREQDRAKEITIFNSTDAFIFPTELLNKKLNTENKPYTIVHGTYKVEPDRGIKNSDGKIHVVYAGTFDPRKGGAFASVGATKFLHQNYHLHILGFGNNENKRKILEEIESANKNSSCKVTFDGLLSGEDYIQFLQSCDIGLSTQNPEGDYNDTSFPSKILSYMANGLRVVCVDIPAVRTSGIGEYMYYYNTQTPEEIAKAIKSINLSDEYDSRAVIAKLDDGFICELKKLLGD